VNATQLLDIIKKGNRLENEDYQQLLKLHELFPYFQIPKVLLAKYEYDTTSGENKEMLHWAAITSPNRSWLRQIIETSSPFHKLEDQLGKAKVFTEIEKPNDTPPKLIDDLEGKEIEEIPAVTTVKDRAEVLKMLEEHLQKRLSETASKNNPSEAQEREQKKAARKAASEDLIETIRRKEKKEILDEKKKAQIDIIKAFSKKEIKLATIKELEKLQKQPDLSERSTRLDPNFISESYARMLTKQGKKQKAIEIYQKLMVKFPDKSTYFADLIKNLEE
jgi:tetratricopeptide (TPR) repeat protein